MKKIISIFITLLLIISFTTPVFATSLPSYDPETGLPFELAEYSDAYIDFTLRLDSVGIVPMTSIETFSANYIGGCFDSMDMYIEYLVEQEISWSNDAVLSMTVSDTYDDLMNTRSLDGMWYDNNINADGEIELTSAPYYGYYNLMTKVKAGDIIQETNGSIVTQITGHIAIVQGKYYDTDYYQYYIRTIEANNHGVVYGVLDDNRLNYRGIRIHYVSGATNDDIDDAINFCASQIGKPYNYDGLLGNIARCQYLASSTKWYCTELVWAAYYNQGINLNDAGGIPENIYMPSEFGSCTSLSLRSYT